MAVRLRTLAWREVAGTPRRRGRALTALSVLGLVMAAALGPPGAAGHGGGGATTGPPPEMESNFAATVEPPDPCVNGDRDAYEKRMYKIEGWRPPEFERYPGACERLHFAYGPITVKPGQNDVLVEPVTIQSPRRNGYLTRFEPNLVLPDGVIPPVEDVHLHHGTWLSVPTYGGTVPFLASGEEKTIGSWPKGYGMPIKATDQWELLYMIHSAVAQPMQAYITYDIDFVPAEAAKELGMKPAYPVWLDVRPSGYPVFNVQRGYGSKRGRCTWPKQECAAFDPWGEKIVGQGKPGNGVGTDFTFPGEGEELGQIRSFTGGTLIGIGGHLHPGGLTDTVDLVRDGRSRRIFTSEAIYWKRSDPEMPGGPPTSWDLSMTVTGLPFWSVRVEPGDSLRINATYDTTRWSTYENMGIAIAALAPHGPDGEPSAPGIDPFEARRDRSRLCRSEQWRLRAPVPRLRRSAKRRLREERPRLCDRGIVTHGHQEPNGYFGEPQGRWNAQAGERTTEVGIANFRYYPGDLSSVESDGVPTVKLGDTLRFTNIEGAGIYHTITTCKFPCLGPTGAAFPLSDGQTSDGRDVDLDSGQLGFGAPYIGPAKQRLDWALEVEREAGFEAGEVVTYYCRIHPWMRGAFQVTQ